MRFWDNLHQDTQGRKIGRTNNLKFKELCKQWAHTGYPKSDNVEWKF